MYNLEYAPKLRSIKLSDVYINGSWDVGALHELVPLAALDFITSFSFTLSPVPDVLIWEPSTDGGFSFTTAVNLLSQHQCERDELSFIWDKRLPLKISVFSWRLLNGLLPLPEILMSFGFQLPSKCPMVLRYYMRKRKKTEKAKRK